MGDPSQTMVTTRNPESVTATASGVFVIWLAFAILAVVMAASAILIRLMAGPRFDGLLIMAACASAVLLAFRIPRNRRLKSDSFAAPAPPVRNPINDILESSGPAVVAIGLDGRLTYANSSAERMIGCDQEELKRMFG